MNHHWKKRIYKLLFSVLLILIAVVAWNKYSIGNSSSTPATNPIATTPSSIEDSSYSTLATNSIATTPSHLPIFPIYLQNDPRWKYDKIGGSQQTLGAVGCTVCCVSMALAHHGIDLPPNELNELLKANEGYTQQGWLKWYTVSKITHNKIGFSIPSHPSLAMIDAALEAGKPVIAKIRLYDIIFHWVLIVKKEGQEYLIKDPLGDGKSLDKLSKFKSKIYAVRIVKKTE
jgi:hypothetical protein